MISKKIEEITKQDIELLQSNGVSESKTLDYKEKLPGNADTDKREFLADVSSFANTAGGDLVFGVSEVGGIVSGIPGLDVSNTDAETLRLESVIRDGLSPKVGCHLRFVPLDDGKYVLVLRVSAGWDAPYRVTFRGHDKFYARNSAGKYPMDVAELRIAFNQSEAVERRMSNFRRERVFGIASGDTPVPLRQNDGLVVIHVMPLSSFTVGKDVDFVQYNRDSAKMRPFNVGGWSTLINIDGVVGYSPVDNGESWSYMQLYRNGVIEAVNSRLYSNKDKDSQKVIPSKSLEDGILEQLPRMLDLLSENELDPPIYLFVSLMGTKGCIMGTGSVWYPEDMRPISKEEIFLPSLAVTDYGSDLSREMKPLFDMVWNACGFEGSQNYNDDGSRK